MSGRKRTSSDRRGMSGRRKSRKGGLPETQAAEKDAEIARLATELAEAQTQLKQIGEHGVEAYTARKIETLLAAAQIARGQALDASLARSRAEGELRALEKAIMEARGLSGWLLRRAARRVRPPVV